MVKEKILAQRTGKIVYKDGDKVIKLFDGKYFPKSDILNEALNQARVEETGLPIMIADDPLTAVVLGSGKALDQLDILSEVTLK